MVQEIGKIGYKNYGTGIKYLDLEQERLGLQGIVGELEEIALAVGRRPTPMELHY